MPATTALEPSAVRLGRATGRYFRESFAQGGLDLVQVIPELVTNADAAIAAGGRPSGRITLAVAAPHPELVETWRAQMRKLRSPALLAWKHELRCTDDGEGVDAPLIDSRLGALGVEPPQDGQRGLFGRGLRDVWLAQGGGRIEGVRGGRAVESWFFPAAGDEPYAFVHVRDHPASASDLAALGVEVSGARVSVPLAAARVPQPGRLRMLVSQLVQLRPVLEDPARVLLLEYPGEPTQLISYPQPEPDPERPLLADREVQVSAGVSAHIVVRRSREPLSSGFSRATRRGGLVVRSGRAAHETTLASFEGRPGTRHLYGEVRCEAIETLQREALGRRRPELVVKVDRSGLNEHHPMVKRLYGAIDRVLGPIVASEERRAGAHLIAPPRALAARDQVGLRALNDALKAAFEQPGKAAAQPGGGPARGPAPPELAQEDRAAQDTAGHHADADADEATSHEPDAQPGLPGPGEEDPHAFEAQAERPTAAHALWFRRSPIRLRPGERRAVALLSDPGRIPPGTPVEVEADPGLSVALRDTAIPEPRGRGASSLHADVRARVTAEPGSRLLVLAAAAEHTCELEVLIVRHRASGWVREIARKDSDQVVEAEFDAETGVVTVYEGRREFRALERAARRAGYPRRRAAEYVPFRMLEVEAAAGAVYAWAAQQIVARRLPEERPSDPAEYAAAVAHEAHELRHRTHHKLMQAFLEPEVFEGTLGLARPAPSPRAKQLSLSDGQGAA